MEETGYEIISKNPQIIKLIKNSKDKKNDIFIGFSEVIADDDEIQKIILIHEHEMSNFGRGCRLYEKVIIITRKYKYIPLIEGHVVDKYCNYDGYNGLLRWDYTFENLKLDFRFSGWVNQKYAYNGNIDTISGKLSISFTNHNYNYDLDKERKTPHTGYGNGTKYYKKYVCRYDESTKKYIFTEQGWNSDGWNPHDSPPSVNIEKKNMIDIIPLIKCVVLGDGDDVDKSDKLKAELSELQNKSDLNDRLIINLKTVNNKMSDEIVNLKNHITKLETENAELNKMNDTKDIFIDKLEKIIEKMTEEANQYCFRCYDKYVKSAKTINCEHKYICHHCTIILKECPKCNSPYN